jgi:hypothetical protein
LGSPVSGSCAACRAVTEDAPKFHLVESATTERDLNRLRQTDVILRGTKARNPGNVPSIWHPERERHLRERRSADRAGDARRGI